MLPPHTYTTKSGVEICEWDENIGGFVLAKLNKFVFEMPGRIRTQMACKIQMRHLRFIIWAERRNPKEWKNLYGA